MRKFLSVFAALILLCCPTLVKAADCTLPNSIVSVKNNVLGAFAYVEFRVKLPTSPSFSYTVTNVTGSTFVHDASGAITTVPGPLRTQVKFQGVEWMCSIPISLTPWTPVKAIKNTSQFEGHVTFVIGRCAGSQYVSTADYSSSGYRIIKLKFKKCKHKFGPYCSACQPCWACCE